MSDVSVCYVAASTADHAREVAWAQRTSGDTGALLREHLGYAAGHPGDIPRRRLRQFGGVYRVRIGTGWVSEPGARHRADVLIETAVIVAPPSGDRHGA